MESSFKSTFSLADTQTSKGTWKAEWVCRSVFVQCRVTASAKMLAAPSMNRLIFPWVHPQTSFLAEIHILYMAAQITCRVELTIGTVHEAQSINTDFCQSQCIPHIYSNYIMLHIIWLINNNSMTNTSVSQSCSWRHTKQHTFL